MEMETNETHWFCIRSHPKHEHIAAAQLRQWEGIEVFCPRLRFRRKTRTGAAWVTEALFPNYLFARFDARDFLCMVRSTRAVSGIVHFGSKYPLIPHETIEALRQSVGDKEIDTISPVLEIGDAVTIASGAFQGLECVIHRIMPARQRIAVLLELLGQTTLVEIHMGEVIRKHLHPLAA